MRLRPNEDLVLALDCHLKRDIMRKVPWVLGLAVAHAAITMMLLLLTAGRVMSAFDGRSASTPLDRAGLVVVQVLMAPLGTLYQYGLPSAWRHTIPGLDNLSFYANSLLWGSSVSWLIHRRRRHAP